MNIKEKYDEIIKNTPRPMPEDFYPDDFKVVAKHGKNSLACIIDKEFEKDPMLFIRSLRRGIWNGLEEKRLAAQQPSNT